MSNALESRLRALLGRMPGPSDGVEERALATALRALPPVGPPWRAHRPVLLAATGATLLLGLSAGALAAVGALHVSLGASGGPAAMPSGVTVPRLRLPRGARGIEAVIDGRLWLTSRGGLRIEGLPVHAATLSPRALYVAAGIGDSLVAMAPNGTRAWSHPARGRVIAIAWAPSGLRIAYVVRRPRGVVQLRAIEGDGDHDRLLDGAVRPVAPSWRADSLAVAYVSAGGRPVVYDLAQQEHHVVGVARAGATTAVAFAPRGRVLALASGRRLRIGGDVRGVDLGVGSVVGLAWLGDSVAVGIDPPAGSADRRGVVRVIPAVAAAGAIPARLVADGRLSALGTAGGRLVLAIERRRAPTRLVSVRQVLLEVGAGARVDELAVR